MPAPAWTTISVGGAVDGSVRAEIFAAGAGAGGGAVPALSGSPPRARSKPDQSGGEEQGKHGGAAAAHLAGPHPSRGKPGTLPGT